MKKLLLLITAIILLSGCSKEENQKLEDMQNQVVGSLIVFTSSKIDLNIYWVLIVDSKELGLIKYSTSAPDCNTSSFPIIKLMPGDHTIEFKALNGTFPKKEMTITIKPEQCLVFDFHKDFH